MVKVKITCRGGPSPSRRDTLAKALYDANIRVLRYYDIHDGYLSIVEDNDHAERLFSAEIVASLGKLGFTPVLPLDMKAKLWFSRNATDRS